LQSKQTPQACAVFGRSHFGLVKNLALMAHITLGHDPAAVLAIVAQGDEVLDWREMVARYPQATLRLIPGSDHGLSDFDAHLPSLTTYLGWGSAMP
jgi:predicted esterase YcpF (UPF0227 family)